MTLIPFLPILWNHSILLTNIKVKIKKNLKIIQKGVLNAEIVGQNDSSITVRVEIVNRVLIESASCELNSTEPDESVLILLLEFGELSSNVSDIQEIVCADLVPSYDYTIVLPTDECILNNDESTLKATTGILAFILFS